MMDRWNAEIVTALCSGPPALHFCPACALSLSDMSFFPRLCHVSPPCSALPNCERSAATLLLVPYIFTTLSLDARPRDPGCPYEAQRRCHSRARTWITMSPAVKAVRKSSQVSRSPPLRDCSPAKSGEKEGKDCPIAGSWKLL